MIHKIFESTRRFAKINKYLRTLLLPLRIWMDWRIRKGRERLDRFYQQTFDAVEEGSLAVRAKDFLGVFEIDFRSHILRRILEKSSTSQRS